MDNPFSRLLKVLDLERKQGFRNKAVIGGLDKFASRWESDALAQAPNRTAVAEVVSLLIGYPAVEDTSARERIVDELCNRTNRILEATPETAEQPPRLAAPPPEKPRRDAPVAVEKPAASSEETRIAAARPAGVPGSGPAEAPPARPLPARNKPETAANEASQAERNLTPPRSKPGAEAPAPVVRELTSQTPPPVAIPTDFSGLDAPVSRLPNIGPSFSERLGKLGIHSVRDLLFFMPRRYEDLSQLRTIDKLGYGERVTLMGTVWDLKHRTLDGERRMVTAVVGDGTGEVEITWFSPFVERRLRVGRAYTFAGSITSYRGKPSMRNPEFEPVEAEQVHTGRITPVYRQTEGVSARWLRRILHRAIDAYAEGFPDPLPEQTRREARLVTLGEALRQVHFPDSMRSRDAGLRRLSFDEFLYLELGVLMRRRSYRTAGALALASDDATLTPFLAQLPFALTAAQTKALDAIRADLRQAQPMVRLLQGDVGSGKTVVAAAALWCAVSSGAQGAIMVPTEILAEQHARSFARLFAGLENPRTGRPVRIELLTANSLRATRDETLAALAAGEIDIAIGTQALIQGGVTFKNLAMAVVDEQHRFGVEQRGALVQKGLAPHLLVMSATPIPRSLAMTVYGDLDVSVIDALPAGRKPVTTAVREPEGREAVYDYIRRQAGEGRQAFIVYPAVEESAIEGVGSAVEEYERLKAEVFPALKIGLLHGRLRSSEKEEVMRAFVGQEIDVLVATSVVEVGIDVPNATVIMIENADRFGLAQLHQFRGRVGRGGYPSYCVLIAKGATSENGGRLQALRENDDGFALARIDLEMRGPGDFFGTQQSGLPALRTAHLSDLRTIEQARDAAQKLLAEDPELRRPEHALLADQASRFWSGSELPA